MLFYIGIGIVLVLVVFVGLFVYAAKRDGTLEQDAAANKRWD